MEVDRSELEFETDVTEEVVEVDKETDNTLGIVCDCKKLRVRQHPFVTSETLYVLNEGAEVMINLEHSTKDFYNVYTQTGVEGFCMKQFIAAC